MNIPSVTKDTVTFHVDPTVAVAKTTAVGGGAVASYLTLNEWVAIATLAFIALQVGLLIPKYWQLYKCWRHGSKIKVELDDEGK